MKVALHIRARRPSLACSSPAPCVPTDVLRKVERAVFELCQREGWVLQSPARLVVRKPRREIDNTEREEI